MEKRDKENKVQRRKLQKPIIVSLLVFYSVLFLARIGSQVAENKFDKPLLCANLSHIFFSTLSLISVYYVPAITTYVLVLDFLGKMVAVVISKN